MEQGILNLGKYSIEPKTRVETFENSEFNRIKIKNGVVYISNNPMELNGLSFWVSIFCNDAFIKKIELRNADEKYKLNYQTMDAAILESLKRENEEFLAKNLGEPDKKSISGLEYIYSWGKIVSYIDIKSTETGIAVMYF